VSREFIEKGYNQPSIQKAVTQQRQLNYLLNSKLQEDKFSSEYLKQWAERKFEGSDYFLNYVKSIFKTENFLTFIKYLRFPLPSSKLVHNRIEPQLQRVFNAEDADFKYDVRGKEYAEFKEDLNLKQFNNDLFTHILYNHNSVVIADLRADKANSPYRYFVNIEDVKSVKEENDCIQAIAFTGTVNGNTGYIYIDSEQYSFYDNDYNFVDGKAHDLGHCPACFYGKKYNSDFVIRESLFTYVREELEEYNFLKTLQKMTEVNGAIPVISKLESKNTENVTGEPNVNNVMGSATNTINNQLVELGTGDLQPGTIHEIPIGAIKDDDGKFNMDLVKNYLNFHYTPIEALDYLDRRIKSLETSIISAIVGDSTSSSEEAKNEDQIRKGISVLENTLSSLAETMNTVRKQSDMDMLGLKYGMESVNEVFVHYGTDFFLDSQDKLFSDLEKAPNPLERKNIIVRISQNRYKNNTDQLSRQKLLYSLMPYASDKDFDKALNMQIVNDVNKEFQIRFNYWVDQFEAYYGDIVTFYKEIADESKSAKMILINNLITEMISKQLIKPIIKNEDSNLD
jgi:hypothetical protein